MDSIKSHPVRSWIVSGCELQHWLEELYCEAVRARMLGLELKHVNGIDICPPLDDVSSWWAVSFQVGREGVFDCWAEYRQLGSSLQDWPEFFDSYLFDGNCLVRDYLGK